jgi:hypothetical protein
VVYNSRAPLISFENSSAHKNFTFCNNIFIGSGKPISGVFTGSSFIGNDWWNTGGDIKFMNFASLDEWAKSTGQEMIKGRLAGLQLDPKFKGPLLTDITDSYQLENLSGYILLSDSPLKNKGLDLKTIFGIEQPARDFYGNPVPVGAVSEPGIYKMK